MSNLIYSERIKFMQNKEKYANGQAVYQYDGNKLTYFFKDGKVKALGISDNNIMEGEWKFYRGTGELWQVGHFLSGKKNGTWIRYDKNGQVEYSETFIDDQLVKK
ncbi:toxin-antitoxin system YwqK family antitoxin [Alkalibaculum sporogenes]|uniref:toxin-antitoxin system YwqK family antitoxin n=1 Tax=Alkalibaculum sporogenes TaxID=2655001 RepID=UPI00187B6FE0|nr:hypothetical protein [Alkalibaculum sporogenes]